MKKFAAALAFAIIAVSPVTAMAQDAVLTEGKMLYTAEGKRLAAIYRVGDDGTVHIILNGRMVTVPAASITVADGKATTNLGRPDLLASREVHSDPL